ncbi:hypothetical protein V8E36_002406 [Tilletia maclaganii]
MSSSSEAVDRRTLGYSPTLLLLSMSLCAFSLHRLRNGGPRAAATRWSPSAQQHQHKQRSTRNPRLSMKMSTINCSSNTSSSANAIDAKLPAFMMTRDFSVPMQTRAAVLANLPTTIADMNFCALASLSQWDSLAPGQHSSSLAGAARVRSAAGQTRPLSSSPPPPQKHAPASVLRQHQQRQQPTTQKRIQTQPEDIEDGQPFHLAAEMLHPTGPASSSSPPPQPAAKSSASHAELELELRKTRDELAAAKAWMREACERLGMTPPSYGRP